LRARLAKKTEKKQVLNGKNGKTLRTKKKSAEKGRKTKTNGAIR